MDWYFRRESDDLVVPNDQDTSDVPCTEGISPSSDEWYQVESNNSGSAGSPQRFCGRSPLTAMDEFNFTRQNTYVQNSKDSSFHLGEGSGNSSAQRESSLINSTLGTSDDSFQGPPDFQLQSSMEHMDDIFLNSLLDDDLQNMGSPYESLPMFSDSSLSFENFLMDVIVDLGGSMKDPTRYENSTYSKACSFPQSANESLEDCNKENSSASSIRTGKSKTSEDSPTKTTVSSETDAIVGMDESNCLEATVLHELEDVMIKLNQKTRICFRDALYRLAENSKKAEHQNRSSDCMPRLPPSEGNCEYSRKEDNCLESKTNVIDRTVANLMFNKPSTSPQDPSCTTLLSKSNSMTTTASGSHRSLEPPPSLPHAPTYKENNGDRSLDGFTKAEPASIGEYFLSTSSQNNMYPNGLHGHF